MRILVTFAVEAEFAPWRRRHAFVSVSMPTPVGLQPHFFYRGTVFENDVDVLLTGIGWDESKRGNWPRYALRELLKNKPDLLISSGLAGGLRADLRCSDIVAAREVSLRAGGETFRSSANLLAIAKDSGARIDMKQITEPSIVAEASAKAALSKFGDFVDMEGYHILQIMSGTRIPSISVRAISDTRDVELPCEIGNVVNRDGRVQTIPLLKLIIKQPGRIRSLLNFGTQSRNAAISIADFLDRFLEAAGGSGSEAQAKRETVAAR
jgi:nucleoside phosphorylase